MTYADGASKNHVSRRYHPNGYMSAVLHSGTPEHRPRGTSIAASPEQLEKDEHKWALLAQHASGYSGPFSLDLSHQQVG